MPSGIHIRQQRKMPPAPIFAKTRSTASSQYVGIPYRSHVHGCRPIVLGSILVASFELAAMGRANVPPSKRPESFLAIDEFHNFATDSFASILSESRKYGLALTLANQYISQIDERVRDAVFGNVGTHISFRVGESDATVMSGEFGSLGNFHMLAKVLNKGKIYSTRWVAHSMM